MLTQFLNTTSEIEALLADNFVPDSAKIKLNLLSGQKATEAHLAERNRILEAVNNELAKDALASATPNELTVSTLGLSRLPSTILQFIQQHHTTLQVVNFSHNNLTSLPIEEIGSLTLTTLDLHSNRFSLEAIAAIKTLDVARIAVLEPQKKNALPTQRVYTPQRASTSQQGFPMGPQIRAEISPESHTLRNEGNSCNIL